MSELAADRGGCLDRCVGDLYVGRKATLVATPTPCPSVPICRQLEFLRVEPPTVNPPIPLVGDSVEFAFAISSSGHQPPEFSCPCTFEADAALLDGDEPAEKSDAHTVVVRRRAARAGVVAVVLHVRGSLEYECFYSADPSGGCVHYTTHYAVDASSPPFALTLDAEPTPTSTPTPTPVETGPRPGGDGCQLGAHPLRSGTSGMAFLSAVLLLACRARVRRGPLGKGRERDLPPVLRRLSLDKAAIESRSLRRTPPLAGGGEPTPAEEPA